ncbi:undecaprenyl/decaprenyl-phosphate alpha-N-acetylglucosaminyl 1-phosphate transferase [candidate division WOR-3 bacterium]|nr:undecaprenyl/decaprenyl-phosphate alpha-N-acetylglucosaminyl 1-phosphate transferase [candidate division WOR-3 bacterium]
MTVFDRILKLLAAFLAGTAGVWLARTIARKLRLLNNPNPIVETHREPVPYLGGAGIFLAYGVLLVLFSWFKTWALLFLAAVWILVILGTIDDLRPLRWWIKLAVEVVVVSIFLPLILGSLGIAIHPILTALGVIAVLIITNGFNLIDVADGLAAGTGGMISLGLFWALLFYSSRPELATAPLLLIGALGGFLIFNRPKASIYLGDGGSLPLGMALGILLVVWFYDAGLDTRTLIVFLALASPFLFDVALVSFHRIRKGKSPFKGSPDHFALRLIHKGWKAHQVLLVTLVVCVYLVASIALLWLPEFCSWIYAGLLLAFYFTSFIWLSRIKVNA